MFLLTAPIVKNNDILAETYFIFLKNVLDHTWKDFRYRLRNSVKRSVKLYPVKQNLALFRNLVALILNWNYVKSLIVTKIFQNFMFGGHWGELDGKIYFQRLSANFYFAFYVFSNSSNC